MDCDHINFRLDEIVQLVVHAKTMLGEGNTGVQFAIALDAIEISVSAIRKEQCAPLPPRRGGPYDNA